MQHFHAFRCSPAAQPMHANAINFPSATEDGRASAF